MNVPCKNAGAIENLMRQLGDGRPRTYGRAARPIFRELDELGFVGYSFHIDGAGSVLLEEIDGTEGVPLAVVVTARGRAYIDRLDRS